MVGSAVQKRKLTELAIELLTRLILLHVAIFKGAIPFPGSRPLM
jgi:hypothetical protein